MRLFALILLATAPLYGMYMGNPSAPQVIEEGFFFCKTSGLSVKLGYQRDWTFHRQMKGGASAMESLDAFTSLADQGVIQCSLFERLELYTSLGGASFFVSNHLTQAPTEIQYQYQTDTQAIWSLGFRLIPYLYNRFAVGVSGGYQRAHPEIKWLTRNGALEGGASAASFTFSEWQVGLGISYEVGPFIPYMGVKYSNVSACFQHLPAGFLPSGRLLKIDNQRKFGLVVGTTLSTGARFATTVELRLVDEQATTLSAEIKF